MEKFNWNHYQGYKVDFINPQNTQAGWQYDAVLIGMDPVLVEGMEAVQIKDKDGNYVLIPIELANSYILIHSTEQHENLFHD